MIDTYLQQAMALWPTELHQIAAALRLVLPALLIGLAVWLIARVLQHLIDRMERDHPAPMRTADAEQVRRDVEELLWRGAQGFENTYPVHDQQRPRKRAGAPGVVPFPSPDAQVRKADKPRIPQPRRG